MITELQEIENKPKKKSKEEEEQGFFYNLFRVFKKDPEDKKKYLPDSNNKNPVNLVSETNNFKKPLAETPVEIVSSPLTNEANQINVASTQAASNNLNSETNQNNFPRYNALSEANPDIKNFYFSNLSIGFSGITGNNIVGGLIAKAAKNMLGLRENGGENSVPELDKIINNLGLKGLGGDVAWCAKLTSAAAGCAATELDKIFGSDGKISKIFPEGTSVLNIAEHFKNNNSLISPKEISHTNPYDLVGTQLLLSRGNGGHTGIVTDYDEKTGIITVVEGNLGSGKTAEVRYNLANLVSKGGTTNSEGEYKTKLIGFGDYNSLIKNADPELFASLQKNNSVDKNFVQTKKNNNTLSV